MNRPVQRQSLVEGFCTLQGKKIQGAYRGAEGHFTLYVPLTTLTSSSFLTGTAPTCTAQSPFISKERSDTIV